MVKLIQIPGQTVSSTSGNRLVNLTSAYEIINRNIKERERQQRIEMLQNERIRLQEQAKKDVSFGNIAKMTGQNIWQGVKELGKEAVGTTAAVGADFLNVIQPWKKDQIKSVNLFGKDFITPSERGTRAGLLAKEGKYEEALGELETAGLDIISTVWLPGKGLQILKGGKYVKGALQGATAGLGYGTGYGVAGAMREGKETKEVLKEGATGGVLGAGAGLTLGLGTSMIGKLFSRKAEIIEKPQVFTELVGKPKNAIDYMATRPNLKIVEAKNLGKSIDGGKIQSRLEWDYKNNKGILLMTKNTTDEAFAHEIGHYIDKSNPELVNKYKNEVIKISGGKQNLNEDFAFAVKEIITNPEARKIAPKLTSEIEGLGIAFDEQIKPKEVPTTTPEASKLTTEPIKPKVEVKTPEDPLIQEARYPLETTGKYNGKPYYQLDAADEIRAVKDGSKPIAINDVKTSELPHIETTGVKGGKTNIYYNPNSPDSIARAKELDSLVRTVSKTGEHTAETERRMGELLGYPKEEIDQYIKDVYINKTGPRFDAITGEPLKSQPLQEGVKPKKTSEIKKTMSETPTAVQNVAKKTYQKELKVGATKKQATKKAIEKVEVYEKKIDKIAKEVSIIEQLKEARKKQGPTPRKKVKTDGVNWETLNTSDETDDLLKSIYAENEQFKDVRPSRTNQDIIEGARAVGIDVNNPAELDKVLRDMPNANTALKLKQSMVDSANDLMNYLKTIDTGTATTEQLNKVKDKFLRTQAIAKAFSGLRTESSHLLRSMGIEVREGENMAEMATKLKEILGESTDTSSFIRKSQEIINPTVIDTVQAIWYNSILSGWKTWTRNILDTTNSFIAETISKGVNPATIIEVPRFVAGLIKGFPKSIVKAGKVLIGSEQFSNKMEYTTRVAPYFKNKHLNFWATEVSGRILSAQDVVFHSTAKSALDMVDSFSKQMQRAGVGERIALELNEAMNKQSADRILYRNKPLGSIGVVSEGIGRIASKVKALKFIVPFTRVVANVTDRKIDYLPILNIARTFGKKYINEEARIILKSTSIPPSQYDKLMPIITKRLRDQQLGRLYLGTLFSVGAYGLASNGRLSGAGPSNANERKQLMDTGWRPYSVKIGDKWIPYTYFGPLSGILAGAGSIHDSIKYDRKGESPTKLVANGLFGFAQNLMTTSFIQGVGDIFEVLSGRGLKPADYMRNFITGLLPIPAMWTQSAQALDGKSYDIQTWGEAIQWKLGISKDGLPLTKNLTPRLNALGEDIRADLIYGITPAKERKELQTKLTNIGLVVNVPAKSTKLGEETMTREQLFEYTIRRGELIKKNMEQILSSVGTKQSKEDKEKEFNKWINDIGEEAKDEMKTKYNIQKEKKYSPKQLIKPKPVSIIK